jgi:MraZ protein
MLTGEFRHNLDPKRRLSIPSRFRKEIGDGAFLTAGLDGCLAIYPQSRWNQFVEKLLNLPMGKGDNRAFLRNFSAKAVEVEFDSLGRVLVPEYMKSYAGLIKDIVVVGALDRVEIWDSKRWQSYKESSERNSDNIAEKLGEMGII